MISKIIIIFGWAYCFQDISLRVKSSCFSTSFLKGGWKMVNNAIETVRDAEQHISQMKKDQKSRISQLHKDKEQRLSKLESELNRSLKSCQDELETANQAKVEERKTIINEDISEAQSNFESDYHNKSDAIAYKIVQEVLDSYGSRQNEKA